MTVSKKKARAAEIKLLTFLLAIFLGGGAVGGTIAAAVSHNPAPEETTAEERYGTRDGKIIDEEPLVFQSSEDDNYYIDSLPLSEELQEYTYYICKAYYIDYSFVLALMFTESSFKADIISKSDDYGLMQINSCNHKDIGDKLGVTDFLEPHQNIRAGMYLLRKLFEKYDTPERVLMAYNLGEYGASVLWDKGITETTYSKKVLTKADEYAALIENSTKK